jgi:hypothetical protein
VTPVTVTPVNCFGGLRTSHFGCLRVKVVLTYWITQNTDSYIEPCVQISCAILIGTWFIGVFRVIIVYGTDQNQMPRK